MILIFMIFSIAKNVPKIKFVKFYPKICQEISSSTTKKADNQKKLSWKEKEWINVWKTVDVFVSCAASTIFGKNWQPLRDLFLMLLLNVMTLRPSLYNNLGYQILFVKLVYSNLGVGSVGKLKNIICLQHHGQNQKIMMMIAIFALTRFLDTMIKTKGPSSQKSLHLLLCQQKGLKKKSFISLKCK